MIDDLAKRAPLKKKDWSQVSLVENYTYVYVRAVPLRQVRCFMNYSRQF